MVVIRELKAGDRVHLRTMQEDATFLGWDVQPGSFGGGRRVRTMTWAVVHLDDGRRWRVVAWELEDACT